MKLYDNFEGGSEMNHQDNCEPDCECRQCRERKGLLNGM